MYKNAYQSGFFSIFHSIGSKPLGKWDTEVHNGHIKRLTDEDIQSLVLEVASTNVSSTYITTPPGKGTLGIKLPYLVMIIKNMKKYFTFEVEVLDDKGFKRRFRASNFQPFVCSMPMRLDDGWNQVQFNLADFTRRAYGTNYLETLRVTIHASCRVRRVYFCDRLYTEDELPLDFKLFLPLSRSRQGARAPATAAVGQPAEEAWPEGPSGAPPTLPTVPMSDVLEQAVPDLPVASSQAAEPPPLPATYQPAEVALEAMGLRD